MEQYVLKPENITQLIESGARSGVRRLEIGEKSLVIEFFGDQTKSVEGVVLPADPKQPVQDAPGTVAEMEVSPEIQKQLDELHRLEHLENMRITNPLLYEELLAKGGLEDVQDEQIDRGAE